MEYEKIEKVYEGAYLDYYNVTYRNEDGQEKVYEMVSRDKQIDSKEKLYDHSTDAVVMIVNDVSDEHVVLVKEFRLELGKTIFGFPAGLIDPGETAAECAVRELKEETGLDVSDFAGGYVFSYTRENPDEGDNYFVDIYCFTGDFSESDLHLQKAETDGYMLVTADEIKELGVQGKFLHYDSIKQVFA